MSEFFNFDLTMKERVLAALENGPTCGVTFLEAYIPRYPVYVQRLRESGFQIETTDCPYTWHRHNPQVATYRLTGRPQ